MTLDALATPVMASENRAFSFTDKESGYFYGLTHEAPIPAWHGGWNIATKRVLKDYALSVDGVPLDRAEAEVTVAPDRVTRRHARATEVLRLFDRQPVIEIALEGVQGDSIGLALLGDIAVPMAVEEEGYWFAPVEDAGAHLLAAPLRPGVAEGRPDGTLTTRATSGGFVLIHGRSREAVLTTLAGYRAEREAWTRARRGRMQALLDSAGAQVSSDPDLDRALAWLTLTGDSLVTRQLGTGIYAGLPWFNDYWGRDTFIALPGLTLVTGQFDSAREVLASFARLQNTDPSSRYQGRVPNRARPDDIIYNTTDGTPRFVKELLTYARYSGDRATVQALYPAMKLATDQAIANWADGHGFLTHEDADTWMDAKERGVRPFSPRGDRANDIQALWHGQLVAAAEMAVMIGDTESAARWRALAARIEANYPRDFIDPATGQMADHLDADGARDMKMRPNQFFALHLVPDAGRRAALLKDAWQALVYPWGVASLDQDDPDFHPYHEHWNFYHKDAAYHNGTVWQWLNGIAMQRLLEMDQPDAAWPLFANMNRTVLTEGAVGSMAENADALPRPGADTAKLSGTFLQAWSNAEQLRVWHQHFLGVRPDMLANRIDVRPNLPTDVPEVTAGLTIGTGRLHLDFSAGEAERYRLRAEGIAPVIAFSLPGFAPVEVELADGATLEVERADDRLSLRVLSPDGSEARAFTRDADAALMQEYRDRTALFRDLRFVDPRLNPDLKSLSVYHDPPLTY